MADVLTRTQPRKTRTVTAWTIQILLAAAFTAAAVAKLAAVPMMIEVFDAIGVGQWFRIVTAVVELIGVAALLSRYAGFGAIWLATTMFFATLTHIFILHTSSVPALLLLVLNLVVAWLRRAEIVSTLRTF
jgi:putative oxidoreductase